MKTFPIKSSRLSSKALNGNQEKKKSEEKNARKQMRSLSGEKIQPEAWCPRKREISVNGRPWECLRGKSSLLTQWCDLEIPSKENLTFSVGWESQEFLA